MFAQYAQRQQLRRIPQPKNIATTTTAARYVSKQCLIGSIKLQLRILIPAVKDCQIEARMNRYGMI